MPIAAPTVTFADVAITDQAAGIDVLSGATVTATPYGLDGATVVPYYYGVAETGATLNAADAGDFNVAGDGTAAVSLQRSAASTSVPKVVSKDNGAASVSVGFGGAPYPLHTTTATTQNFITAPGNPVTTFNGSSAIGFLTTSTGTGNMFVTGEDGKTNEWTTTAIPNGIDMRSVSKWDASSSTMIVVSSDGMGEANDGLVKVSTAAATANTTSITVPNTTPVSGRYPPANQVAQAVGPSTYLVNLTKGDASDACALQMYKVTTGATTTAVGTFTEAAGAPTSNMGIFQADPSTSDWYFYGATGAEMKGITKATITNTVGSEAVAYEAVTYTTALSKGDHQFKQMFQCGTKTMVVLDSIAPGSEFLTFHAVTSPFAAGAALDEYKAGTGSVPVKRADACEYRLSPTSETMATLIGSTDGTTPKVYTVVFDHTAKTYTVVEQAIQPATLVANKYGMSSAFGGAAMVYEESKSTVSAPLLGNAMGTVNVSGGVDPGPGPEPAPGPVPAPKDSSDETSSGGWSDTDLGISGGVLGAGLILFVIGILGFLGIL